MRDPTRPSGREVGRVSRPVQTAQESRPEAVAIAPDRVNPFELPGPTERRDPAPENNEKNEKYEFCVSDEQLQEPLKPLKDISLNTAPGGEFFPESFCECHGGQKRECVRASDCSIRALWRTVKAALRDTHEQISLADLRRDELAMGSWLDPITLVPTARPEEKTS